MDEVNQTLKRIEAMLRIILALRGVTYDPDLDASISPEEMTKQAYTGTRELHYQVGCHQEHSSAQQPH